MKEFLHFFIESGKLKKMERRSWLLSGIKKPETIASHVFRVALMTSILAREKKDLDLNKVIRMALAHDLCEVYAGDLTPYDSILPKGKKKIEKLRNAWPRFSKFQKVEISLKKYKKEWHSLIKLTSKLPIGLKERIINLWFDYEGGLTKEARFVRQVDRIESFLQALEYYKKDKSFPIKPWWGYIKERIDDPVLLEFLKELDREFHPKKTIKKKAKK